MKILKKLLVGLMVIIILLVVVSFFLPSKLNVTSSKLIKTHPSVVYGQVSYLENWENWSAWAKMEGVKFTFYEQETGVGAYYTWTGPEGNGKLTIKEMEPGKLINNELDFGDLGLGFGTWNFEALDNGTKVTWTFNADIGNNPITKIMMNFLGKGAMSKSMDDGLNEIANICSRVESISEVEVPGTKALTHRATCKPENISLQLANSYGAVMQVLTSNGATATTQPFAVYHKWDPKNGVIELEAGMGVDTLLETTGDVKSVIFEPTKALRVNYYGDYHGIGVAHHAIDSYISMHKKQVSGPPWEMYVTDPGAEPDTSKWLTQVYYPIQ